MVIHAQPFERLPSMGGGASNLLVRFIGVEKAVYESLIIFNPANWTEIAFLALTLMVRGHMLIRGLEILAFGKFLRMYLMDDHLIKVQDSFMMNILRKKW